MKRRELLAQFVPSSPFVRLLGIELVDVGTDRAVVRLPFREDLVTIADVVHGGALASLIDTGGGVGRVGGRRRTVVDGGRYGLARRVLRGRSPRAGPHRPWGS